MVLRLLLFTLSLLFLSSLHLHAQLGVKMESIVKYVPVTKRKTLHTTGKPKSKEQGYSLMNKEVQSYKSKGYEAFFCRMETKLDKKLKTPIRFRLGSYDYVNGLEGKF